MRNPLTELNDLLTQGENNALEFKSARVRPEALARGMVAFANGLGGTILVGVEDEGAVTGIDLQAKNYEEWAANIARTDVVPPVAVVMERLSRDGLSLLRIDVPKGRDKPYQTRDGQFLVRVGSTNRAATLGELLRLFRRPVPFTTTGSGLPAPRSRTWISPSSMAISANTRSIFARRSRRSAS